MALTTWNPNSVWQNALTTLCSLAQDPIPSTFDMFGIGLNYPAVDIIQNNGYISIIADVPGADAKNVSVTIDNGVLTIKGTRPKDWSNSAEAEPYRERSSGHFSRSFNLANDIRYSTATAVLKEGVLTIFLTLTNKPHPNQVSVPIVSE